MIKNKIIRLGFTFIEILMAVAIMAVLAIIVVPSISERLNRTKVDTAAQTMLKNAQFLHKWANISGGYNKSKSLPGVCPYLPFQYESDSNNNHYYFITSTESYLIGKIGSSKERLKTSRCYANSFTIIAYPICGSSVEKSGAICLDQDGNLIKNADQFCNPRSGPLQTLCVDDATKDDNRDNKPDENNPTAPPIPGPPIDPDKFKCEGDARNNTSDLTCFCSYHESDPLCQSPVFCQDHPYIPFCKCVLHPNEKGCPAYCDTQAGQNDKYGCPGWCDAAPGRRETDPFCKKPDESAVFPSWCIDHPDTEACYDACKFQKVRAEWCDTACQNLFTESIKPDWCPNVDPDPTDKYQKGSIVNDSCNNTLVCEDKTKCNTYGPDSESRLAGWKVLKCDTAGASNFFTPDKSSYGYNEMVNTSSCLTYKCNNPNGCGEEPPARYAPKEDSQKNGWIPCYSTCPATLKSALPLYDTNSYSYDSRCVKLFQCTDNASTCSDINGNHQPGNENAGESIAWIPVSGGDS